MGIFNSYVKLPEGMYDYSGSDWGGHIRTPSDGFQTSASSARH